MGRPHFIAIAWLCAAAPALGADVSLVGVFAPKAAVLVIDGAEPKTLRVGQRSSGVLLVSVESERAVIEVDGERRTVVLGQHYRTAPAPASARQSVVLAADASGHFVAEGTINGGVVRFIVDTGATTIALPARDAQRLGIDYRKGRPVATQTANGTARGYLVKLDTVKLGGIELNGVDAMVLEGGLEITLLGMSFLNRVEIKHEGRTMTLIRRF